MRKLLAWLLAALIMEPIVVPLLYHAAHSAYASEGFVPAKPSVVTDPLPFWLKGYSGTVLVRVRVGADGRVERILENSATDQLKPLYERVAKTWQFAPATRDGKPVSSDARVKFTYTISSSYEMIQP